MSVLEAIVGGLIAKSGAREWDDPDARARLIVAINEIAEGIELMAVSKQLVTEMDGTPRQIVFADHANDFSPTAANDLRKTTNDSQELDVQLSLASVANGAYRQSAKVDLGENRAVWYKVRVAIELAATPTAGNAIDLYWAPSHSGTAGTGNAGNVSGSDAAYTGYSSNAAAAVKQLEYIGSAIVTTQATGTIQVIEVQGLFSPTERYGSLVVLNGSGAAVHSDDVECHVVFDPYVVEGQ